MPFRTRLCDSPSANHARLDHLAPRQPDMEVRLLVKPIIMRLPLPPRFRQLYIETTQKLRYQLMDLAQRYLPIV